MSEAGGDHDPPQYGYGYASTPYGGYASISYGYDPPQYGFG